MIGYKAFDKEMKTYKITIELETNDEDFCSCFGENYIIDNLCESLGCSEDDIEIEEIYNDKTEEPTG